MRSSFTRSLTVSMALLLTFFQNVPATAETLVGSNVDSRVILAFHVNEESAQAFMPEGWKLFALPKGPLAGANLLVAFIDRNLALDAEGKPLDPYSSRSVAILNYGTKEGVEGMRTYITRVYETPPVASSYGNGVSASIARNAALDGPADGVRNHEETWTVKPETGGEISFELSYKSGRPGWSSSEAKPYSNANPDFHRIYRYQQLADLAMSTAIGRELNGEISFQSSVPELAGLFDGNESLIGVLTIPVYVREVSLP